MNIGLIAELAIKCFHKGQNIIKTFIRRIFDFIQDFKLKTRISLTNNDVENLYKIIKTTSDLIVRIIVYASS